MLNRDSVVARKESSLALGTGYRCGFYGMLHLEVFMQRLEQEHGLTVIATSPTVPYRVHLSGNITVMVNNPADFPDVYESVEGDPPLRRFCVSLPHRPPQSLSLWRRLWRPSSSPAR